MSDPEIVRRKVAEAESHRHQVFSGAGVGFSLLIIGRFAPLIFTGLAVRAIDAECLGCATPRVRRTKLRQEP
jgi:hypothetical protein